MLDYLSADKYPKLTAVVREFGAIPAVAAYYAAVADKPLYACFAASAAAAAA
jgi:hypothetical protein